MAHVALRLGIRALCRSRIVSGNLSYNIIMAKSSTLRALNPLSSFRFYSNGATSKLAKQVSTELKLEQRPAAEDLASGFTSFELKLDGALATLTRSHSQEQIKVQVDANHAIEAGGDGEEFDGVESDEEGGMDEESEPFFVPTFTVTITKPLGDAMMFDCSFAEYGDYSEMGNAWDSMQINSISVIPESTADTSVENVYSVDTANMSDELYSAFVEYLQERKIDETFANEILQFYRNFEHQCYIKHFLESVKKFVSS